MARTVRIQSETDFMTLSSRHNGSDDIVLVHDAIRPMVSNDIISDNIRVCRQYGNAITVVPCTAAMLKTFDSLSTEEQVPRDNLKITQTPQAFFLKILLQHIKKLWKRELQIQLLLVRCILNLAENYICLRVLRKT